MTTPTANLPTTNPVENADLPAIITRAIALRHDLHQHPELGYQETYTSALITRELTRLHIPHTTGLGKDPADPTRPGTGILATIQGTAPTAAALRTVALRADMDALPISETTSLPYASLNPGLMHACGHDGHTAILLGAAALLQAAAPTFRGTVKLIFQPAEEGGCGADRMVADGVLDNPRVDAIFGLHGWPGLPVGTAATRPGPLLASVDGFLIKLTGKGTHAASPHDGIDPILAGAAIVQSLQSAISRESDPSDAAVLTVAQFHAGSNFNVIPDTAELNGTIRCLTPARRTALLDSLERIARSIAAAHRCACDITWFGTTPCTNNTPELAAFFHEVAAGTLEGGGRSVFTVPKPALWGEDFAFYLEHVPGCFFVLGVSPTPPLPNGQPSYPMLHNSNYDFTDAAIPHGIKLMTNLALQYLARST